MKQNLTAFLAMAKTAGCKRLCVAYSGGIDSHVLLSHLHTLNQGLDHIPLDAIYINHNLHSESVKWGEHCKQICQNLTVPFQHISVDATPDSGESPEEKARIVRYQALAGELQPDHWLLTAQHIEDQAETLLLQLLRGSGADGLSAMPAQRSLGDGEHHRPLLKVSKQEIEQYATAHDLQWIEDPSNQDQSVARNYLRKTVIPDLEKVWPEANEMLDRSADWMAEASELMMELAGHDLLKCRGNYQSINILELNTLTVIRQKNLLRYWFHCLGLKRPGIVKLNLIFEQIVKARDDASPQLDWQEVSLRRYKDHLYIIPNWPSPESGWHIILDRTGQYNLSDDSGVLTITEVTGRGIAKSFLEQSLTAKLREGGERCHPKDRDHSQLLKKLFQDYSVPPWLRERWPILYCDDQITAVPGLFICKGFEASSSEAGLEFSVEFNDI